MAENLSRLLPFMPPVPALPEPEGPVVEVDSVEALVAAIHDARPGRTILVADGTYVMPRNVVLSADDVQIRGASGNREAVIIDGTEHHMDIDHALLQLTDARRVMIADMTFANAKKYGVLIYGDGDVQEFTAHNVIFRNCWCRGLKGTDPYWPGDSRDNPRNSDEVADKVRPHKGIVRYCLFYADHIKTDREDGFDGDYISGTDMVALSDWHFHDNLFYNLQGANGGGRGAIFIWVGADNLRIENNLFVDCDRSIALGNPSYEGLSVDGALVQGNAIVAGVNRAIECNSTRAVEICNNRIWATSERFPTVEYIDGSADGRLHHNRIHGCLSCEPEVEIEDNTVGDLEGLFRDPLTGDLRLTEKAEQSEAMGDTDFFLEEPGV